MPRKTIRSKRRGKGEVSPMKELILRAEARHYKEYPCSGTEKALRYYALRCGFNPDEYIEKQKKLLLER